MHMPGYQELQVVSAQFVGSVNANGRKRCVKAGRYHLLYPGR